MAAVVDIRPPQPAPIPSFRKIRAASHAFEWLFTSLLALFVALTALGLGVLLFYHGTMIAFGPKGGLITTGPVPAEYLALRDWRFDQRLAYAPVWLIRSAPTVVLFWALRRLFRLYRQGQVFGRANSELIKVMGACLVADALAPGAIHLVLSTTGYEIDKLWFHPIAGLQEAVLGAVVFVIALVMQAGHEIEQDREGFV